MMDSKYKLTLGGALLGAFTTAAVPATAQTMDVSVTIPRLTVAEYHKPYVALWIEQAGKPARTINVWYDTGKKNNAGIKWLRDMRQWRDRRDARAGRREDQLHGWQGRHARAHRGQLHAGRRGRARRRWA